MPLMLPEIQTIQGQDKIISQFLGLNQTDTSNDEMFRDMHEMTSDEYPYLAPRKNCATRSIYSGSYFSVLGSVTHGEDIYTVQFYQESGTPHTKFFKNFEEVSGVMLEQNSTTRQLVVYGAYIVIFPDNVMYNTETEEVTDMSYELSLGASTSNRMYLSDKDGVPFILDNVSTLYSTTPGGFNGALSTLGESATPKQLDARITNCIADSYIKEDFCKFTGTREHSYDDGTTQTLYKCNILMGQKYKVASGDAPGYAENNTYPFFWIEKTGNDFFIKRYQAQNNAWYPADLYVSWRLTSSQYATIQDKIKIGDYIKLKGLKANGDEYTEEDFNNREASWNLVKTLSNGIKVENIITSASNQGVVLVFSNNSLNFLKVLQENKTRFQWGKYNTGTSENIKLKAEPIAMWNGVYYPYGNNDNSLAYQVKLQKTVPQMDYITVSQNRIWGCSSDNHEIYACKQGDATAWYQYAGLSSDSYAVTIPNGDKFTGAVTYSDMPYFFTENMAYSIMGNKPKNYQVQNYELMGVEDGAYSTIAQKDGYVYYKSKSGIERFNGNNAQSLTEYLDLEGMKGYVGQTNNDKYFVFLGVPGNADLYVYDIKKRLWHKERNDMPLEMVELDNNLYLLDGQRGSLKLRKINGKAKEVADVLVDNEPTYDTPKWWVESGEFNAQSLLNKYITKFMFEMKLEQNSKVSIYFMYDDSGEWEEVFRTTDKQVKKLINVPILVRRCERMRYKIKGEGQAKIYSISITSEGGSEIG